MRLKLSSIILRFIKIVEYSENVVNSLKNSFRTGRTLSKHK